MSRYRIRYHDSDRSLIEHTLNQESIVTDRPPEYGGKGRSFSCTDLLASALGSCFFSSILPVLEREAYGATDVEVEVRKVLHQNPKRIERIDLTLHGPKTMGGPLLKKLQNTLDGCPVRRSLHPDVVVNLEMKLQ